MIYADFVWMDREIVAWNDAKIHVLTHGLHYGNNAFEGLRSYKTDNGVAIFRLKEHTLRFLHSAKIINLPIKYSLEELMSAQIEIINKNNLSNAYIRPIAFYDEDSMRIAAPNNKVRVVIAAWSLDELLYDDKSIRAQISPIVRAVADSPLNSAKVTGSYIHAVMAAQQAVAAGYDDAILLDQNGFVSEATVANIFLYMNNKLHSPLTNNCLDGITRRSVIELARDAGIEVIERMITKDELYEAEEIFVTGTAAEIKAVVSVDQHVVGDGKPGAIFKKIQHMYSNVVRGNWGQQYLTWLTSC